VSEIDEIPVEAGTGDRPSSSAGERLLVGLAIATLLGGLLIAAANLLNGGTPTEAARQSAAATTTQRPSPTARPLEEVTLQPVDPPGPESSPPLLSPFEEQYVATHWLSVREELTLRARPTESSLELGSLPAGALALVGASEVNEGWLHVLAPLPRGWVHLEDGTGAPQGVLTPVAEDELHAGIDSIAAGEPGFVAHLWGPAGWASAASDDGEDWGTGGGSLPAGLPGWSAAWGPAGWLAVAAFDDLVWESADGVSWSVLGSLQTTDVATPEQLVGTPNGYLMTLAARTTRAASSIWFSPDGITWQESADPWPDATERLPRVRRLRALDDGFLVMQSNVAGGGLRLAYSADGATWHDIPVEDAGDRVRFLDVAVADGALLGLGQMQPDRIVAWSGSLADGQPALRRDSQAERLLDGAWITAVTSDGSRGYAFGFDLQDGGSRAWVGDASGWRPLPIPADGFATPVHGAAAGAGGVVVAGARIGADGAMPELWHLRADGSWVPEAEPIAASLLGVPASDCSSIALPSSALEFAVLSARDAVACFGDTPMTFDAWSGDCHSCLARRTWWGGQPPWLVDRARFLQLMPYEGFPDQGWSRVGVTAPGIAWDDALVGTWLRVTGHYDDPAAESCRTPPTSVPPNRDPWSPFNGWEGPQLAIWRCQHTFVVTEVSVTGQP
jgi:hypothetical protein